MKPEQWTYVRARIAGKRPQAAFEIACPDASSHMRKKTPYKWEANPEIAGEIKIGLGLGKTSPADPMEQAKAAVVASTLRTVMEAGMTRAEKRTLLRKIANDPRKSPMSRIAAIKTDNEMTGDNAPVRIEGEITLHTIFKSLSPTTGLPSAGEIIEIEGATP